jgi:hypothetical protein
LEASPLLMLFRISWNSLHPEFLENSTSPPKKLLSALGLF